MAPPTGFQGLKQSGAQNFRGNQGCTLKGVLANYCDCTNEIPSLLDFEMVAPWVMAKFGTYASTSAGNNPPPLADPDITVGNESCPTTGNTAAIKSMEWRYEGSSTIRLELVDQQGGMFNKFAENMATDLNLKSKADAGDLSMYYMQVQWGWLMRDATTGATSYQSSPVHTFLSVQMDVQIQNGLCKYDISGTDLMYPAQSLSFTTTYGGTKKSGDPRLLNTKGPMDLQWAETYLFAGEAPPDGKKTAPAINIEFINTATAKGRVFGAYALRTTDGKTGTPAWKYFGIPLGSWHCELQHRMEAYERWTQVYRSGGPDGKTATGAGVTLMWDTVNPKPTVLAVVNPSPNCLDPNMICDQSNHLGTYIWGGGESNPVIDFHATMNWVGPLAGFNKGAVQGGPLVNMKTFDNPGCMCEPIEAGSATAIPAFTKEDVLEFGNSMNANFAAKRFGFVQPIEGELRIQGSTDLRLHDSRMLCNLFLSLIVIQPFYVWDSNDSNVAHWQIGANGTTPTNSIATSSVNQILSNRNWFVKGVTHSIREGSFNTTLKIYLVAPGYDLLCSGTTGGVGDGQTPASGNSGNAWVPDPGESVPAFNDNGPQLA